MVKLSDPEDDADIPDITEGGNEWRSVTEDPSKF